MGDMEEYDIAIKREVRVWRILEGGVVYRVFNIDGRGFETRDGVIIRHILPWVAEPPSRHVVGITYHILAHFPDLRARVRADPMGATWNSGELLELYLDPLKPANVALLTLARERGVTVGELLETLE